MQLQWALQPTINTRPSGRGAPRGVQGPGPARGQRGQAGVTPRPHRHPPPQQPAEGLALVAQPAPWHAPQAPPAQEQGKGSGATSAGQRQAFRPGPTIAYDSPNHSVVQAETAAPPRPGPWAG